MKKVMFVCHGNICRSPMAEAVFAHLAKQEGLDVAVASCATSTDEIGSPIYPNTVQMLKKYKIPYQDRKAVQITQAMYDEYDYIVVMDQNNIRNLFRMVKGDPQGKVKRLLEYANEDRDVADPWYTRDFETTYQDVLKGCNALIAHIKEQENTTSSH